MVSQPTNLIHYPVKETIMSIEKVLLPDVGDFKDSKVIEVLVKVGDRVEQEQSLIVLESDKASMEVPSPLTGKITKVIIAEDTLVNMGDLLVEMEVSSETQEESQENTQVTQKQEQIQQIQESSSTLSQKEPSKEPSVDAQGQDKSPPQAISTTINQQPLGAKYHASPMIRQLANQLGVDLSQVSGSGPKGRITKEDVEGWVKNYLQGDKNVNNQDNQSSVGLPKPPSVDFSKFGEVEVMALSRIKKISGKHLSCCWLNAPHVTQFDEVSIDELEAYRQSYNAQIKDNQTDKLTPLAFFLKAVSVALQEFPLFNASLSEDGGSLFLKKYINIGVAVDTPNGLVVPVIRDVPSKGLRQLASELKQLSLKAREGKLMSSDIQGGCFTISSLGGIGGTHFTPIINLPEVAILGIGKSSIKAQWNGKEFVPSLRLPISVSYDHRVIDGAEGARFIVKLGQYLSDLRNLIL